MERRDVVIVGAGPAGAATALHLVRRDPALAGRVLVLDKAAWPRDKVCAGGLIPNTLDALAELGVALTVPHVMVDRGRCDLPAARIELARDRLCAVVRRREFDASLMAAVRAAGVEVREGARVRGLARTTAGARVDLDDGAVEAAVVVGADGAGSLVRRRLFGDDGTAAVGRAVMADVPLADAAWDGHARRRYDFDFRGVPGGLDGYAWLFPCLLDGRPHVNVGVYSRRALGPASLVAALERLAAGVGASVTRHRAAPIRCTGPTPFAIPHALLVGDAAGVEPLMGEGISYAFEYGRWAAGEIAAGLAARDVRFAGAEARFRASVAGWKLRRLGQAARLAYGPGGRLWLGLAARWPGVQGVGLDWYNGIAGCDRQSGWRLLWEALRGPAPVAASARVVQ